MRYVSNSFLCGMSIINIGGALTVHQCRGHADDMSVQSFPCGMSNVNTGGELVVWYDSRGGQGQGPQHLSTCSVFALMQIRCSGMEIGGQTREVDGHFPFCHNVLENMHFTQTERTASQADEKEFSIDNLLVRIHLIIEMILVDRPCAMGV